jgi:zinc transporter 2
MNGKNADKKQEVYYNNNYQNKTSGHDHKEDDEKKLLVNKGKNDRIDSQSSNGENDSPILLENTKKNKETLKKLWIVSFICLLFMIIEIIGGYLASSIAIMSDAAHLLSDLLGFLISIVSIYISRRKATDKMSFGYHRAEVIGALVSVNIIWGLTFWLLYEASLRIIYKQEVNGFYMLLTAIIGFIFNVVMGLTLMQQGIGKIFIFIYHHYVFLNYIIIKI